MSARSEAYEVQPFRGDTGDSSFDATGPRPICLVPRGSPRQLIFAEAEALAAGREARLTLVGGGAVVTSSMCKCLLRLGCGRLWH